MDGLPDSLVDAVNSTVDISKQLAAVQLDCGLDVLVRFPFGQCQGRVLGFLKVF